MTNLLALEKEELIRTFSTLRLINRELKKKKEREKNYLRYNKIG